MKNEINGLRRMGCLVMAMGLVTLMPRLSLALAGEEPILTAILMENKVYNQFMRLQVVEQIKTLRDNYLASQRYYEMMRRTTGKGIAEKLTGEIVAVQKDTYAKLKEQFENDWVKDPGNDTYVDKKVELFNQKMNELDQKATKKVEEKVNQLLDQMAKYGSAKIKIAEEITDSSMAAQKTGKELALLSQKSTESNPVANADLLKALSVQIQVQSQTNLLLAQLLDVNSHTAQIAMNEQATALRQTAIANNIDLKR